MLSVLLAHSVCIVYNVFIMKRLNLSIEDDLHSFVKDSAWKSRQSVNGYINSLIKKEITGTIKIMGPINNAVFSDGTTGTPAFKNPQVETTRKVPSLEMQALIKKQASGRALSEMEKAKMKVAGFTPAAALTHSIKRKLFCRHGIELGKCPQGCTESTTKI